MMRALIFIALVLVAAVPAQADRRTALDADLYTDSAAIPALEVAEQFAESLAAGDLDTAKSLLSENVLVLESGGAEHSRDEYFAHHAAADAKFLADAKQTVHRRHARANKRIAWIATESIIEAGGKKIASNETVVLEKGKGGWKIVHIHWSSR